MKWKIPKLPWAWLRLFAGLVLVAVAGVTYSVWWPPLSKWVDATLVSNKAAAAEHDESESASEPAVTMSSLNLSDQARLNLGLTDEYLQPVELTTFRRSLTMTALVVSRPGRSMLSVSSPLNGVVTHVSAVTGETVLPGDLLFEVRLTYEDLVETQTQYLRTLNELKVENDEIARLEIAVKSGAISGKSLLDRRYAKRKIEAHLRSQSEALRLHGLSERQVNAIASEGKLLRDLQIVAPDIDRPNHQLREELRLTRSSVRPISHALSSNDGLSTADTPPPRPLVIDDLRVHKGQAVVAGELLCTLTDMTNLFIEGKAFEQDIKAISYAATQGWPVEAVFPSASGSDTVASVKLAYIGNTIDQASRKLSIFLELPNAIVRDETNAQGQRYIAWKYRIGQRLRIQVPVEEWKDQIVLPVEAIVKEGAEWFIFQQNGKRFDRVPVHLRYRDQQSAVIANDGSIYPGDVVARRGAHQMLMAIKNASGGGADAHAGHNH